MNIKPAISRAVCRWASKRKQQEDAEKKDVPLEEVAVATPSSSNCGEWQEKDICRSVRLPVGFGFIVGTTNISDRTSIHGRPKEADGKRFGDFEMDIMDGYGHAVLVMPERKTGFVMMEKRPQGKNVEPLAKVAVSFTCRKYVKTVTADNGP